MALGLALCGAAFAWAGADGGRRNWSATEWLLVALFAGLALAALGGLAAWLLLSDREAAAAGVARERPLPPSDPPLTLGASMRDRGETWTVADITYDGRGPARVMLHRRADDGHDEFRYVAVGGARSPRP